MEFDLFDIKTWVNKFGEENLDLDKLTEYLEFIKEASANRDKSRYFEWHHIMPKCLDKSKEYVKYVCLTGADHFRAHLLLPYCFYDDNRRRLAYALSLMKSHALKESEGRKVLAEEYEEASRLSSEVRKRENLTDDFRAILSEKTSGPNNGMYGRTHTEEARLKMSKSQQVRINQPGDSEKRSKSIKSYFSHLTEEDRREMSRKRSKECLSDETRRKMSMSHSEFLKNNPDRRNGFGCYGVRQSLLR